MRYIQADSQAEADKIFFEEMDEGEKNPSSPAARAAKVKYGPCSLEVQGGVHFRKSSNYNSVGFRSYTKCDVRVTSITHYMRLKMKEGIYWRDIVPTEGTSNVNRGEAALSSKGTSFLCPKKSPKHWWSGHTKGVIVYKGETYYAIGNAPVSQMELECHA